MSDSKRIHFLWDKDPSPTIRCRIFGHAYITGTAYIEGHDYDVEELDVCRRCWSVKGRTWEGISSFRNDGGREARHADEVVDA